MVRLVSDDTDKNKSDEKYLSKKILEAWFWVEVTGLEKNPVKAKFSFETSHIWLPHDIWRRLSLLLWSLYGELMDLEGSMHSRLKTTDF